MAATAAAAMAVAMAIDIDGDGAELMLDKQALRDVLARAHKQARLAQCSGSGGGGGGGGRRRGESGVMSGGVASGGAASSYVHPRARTGASPPRDTLETLALTICRQRMPTQMKVALEVTCACP